MALTYILNQGRLFFCLLAMAVPFFAKAQSQNITVVKKTKIYSQQVMNDPAHQMIELKQLMPGIVYDLRYSSNKNFTRFKLYPSGELTFMRLQPAKALQKVQQELNKKGLGLKIFDAYRPYSITKQMWDLIKDEKYVANPANGSGHNRGLSVDLTLINLKTGKELDMGTSFDSFTDTAHHKFNNLPATVLRNRKLLKKSMEQFGFRSLSSEWWHYSWPNDRNYQVLDIDFNFLALYSR